MTAFWVKFKDRKPGCVEAENMGQARILAEDLTKSEVTALDRIPYPAAPRLNEHLYDFGGKKSPCPSFCYTPEQCLGKTSCPKNYACSE